LTITTKSGEKKSSEEQSAKEKNSRRKDALWTGSTGYRFNPEYLASLATPEMSREVVLTSFKRFIIPVF